MYYWRRVGHCWARAQSIVGSPFAGSNGRDEEGEESQLLCPKKR